MLQADHLERKAVCSEPACTQPAALSAWLVLDNVVQSAWKCGVSQHSDTCASSKGERKHHRPRSVTGGRAPLVCGWTGVEKAYIPFSHSLTASGPRYCSSTTPSCPFCPCPPPTAPCLCQRMRPECYKRPRPARFQIPGQHVSREQEWGKYWRQQLMLSTYDFLTMVFFFAMHMHCHSGMLCSGILASS